MSTSIARTLNSIPVRTASATWRAFVDLIAPSEGDARKELLSVEGIACSLVTDQAMTSPMIVTGKGPRVRTYCAYDDSALEGDSANEQPLATIPTEGDWALSLPCDSGDLDWVNTALTEKSCRITARDKSLGIRLSEKDSDGAEQKAASFDLEGFLKR
jgi:hypothetical protein